MTKSKSHQTSTDDSDLVHPNAHVAAMVRELPELQANARARGLIESILETCLAIGRDDVAVPDLKLIDAALGEIRRALDCFQPYVGERKIATFGSARTIPSDPVYMLARDFSRAAVEAGFMIITGAGPGVMRACQEGAGRERSFGVNIRLPFENVANEFIRGDGKLVEFKYFFTRKLFFLKESSAVVLFPGGFGTHDEGFEALTLVQTGKSRLVPIIFMDTPGGKFWADWKRYVDDHLLGNGLIDRDDMALFRITDSIEDAVEEVRRFYRVYHSARTIRNRLVVRTQFPVSDRDVAEISAQFSDILKGKPVARRQPYDEEYDEPTLLELPRLVLHFDMKSYGRLRQLVDRLNTSESA